ncbi:MAG: hypothetical protein KDC34_16255 [Saprospiraceae bacterium]|nr:hypothetical protein [Saprospiraceae bacterium]
MNWKNILQDKLKIGPRKYFLTELLFISGLILLVFSLKNVGGGRFANVYNVLFLVTLLIVFFYSRRRASKNTDREEVKSTSLRNQISQDLHDDVGSLLAALAMQAELYAKENPDDKTGKLLQIQEMSHQAMANMRDIVWSMNKTDKKWGELIDRLQNHAHLLLEGKNIHVSLKLDGMDMEESVSSDVCKHFYLIGKEAITNVFRHSNADHVTICFKRTNKEVEMVIQDNGSTQKKEPKLSSGIGLSNMRERAKSLGAKLNVQSNRGFGVLLSMSL